MKIVAIGKSSASASNGEWTNGHSIPVLVDPYPYNTWTNWGAEQRDLFFIDSKGNYVTDFNITFPPEPYIWDYDKVYNQIHDILSE